MGAGAASDILKTVDRVGLLAAGIVMALALAVVDAQLSDNGFFYEGLPDASLHISFVPPRLPWPRLSSSSERVASLLVSDAFLG